MVAVAMAEALCVRPRGVDAPVLVLAAAETRRRGVATAARGDGVGATFLELELFFADCLAAIRAEGERAAGVLLRGVDGRAMRETGGLGQRV